MKFFIKKDKKGFSLLEVLVATGVFLLFALGIYGGLQLVFKIVYNSRLRILETAVLSEKLEEVRNLPFDQVGIASGVPIGVLPYSTSTIRNGITFNIITTVRNIDDAFDGLATGTPQIDTSPADYKLVEMSIICQNCIQKKPVILSTKVSPKGLEGASNNGSLFIHVFDADGHDIQGATVHVTSSAPTSLNFTDTTDNAGMVKIIDIPTGTEAYRISVSKSGYSTDYTVSSTDSIPNPVKPPSTVISQTVTEISFSIDRLGSMLLTTMNPSCAAIGSAAFAIWGNKIIGQNPTVYKFNQNLVTNGGGQYNFSNAEWDKYNLSASGTIYDIAGSVPMLPINLTPGLYQEIFLVLRPHTTNSFLVMVIDAGTKQPLGEANVRLYKTGYDQTVSTSIGYVRQTDWSGGSGQAIFVYEDQYYWDNSNVDNNSPSGDLKLKKVGNSYQSPGLLESSTFDLGPSSTYRNIVWEPLSQPVSTSIKFQLATSNTSTPSQWNFVGPDGTVSTYYTTTSSLIYNGHNGQRYLRYKAYLETQDSSKTPQLSEVLLTYTNECTPPGQAFFNNLSAGTYTLEVSRNGYSTVTDPVVEIAGNVEEIVNLSLNL